MHQNMIADHSQPGEHLAVRLERKLGILRRARTTRLTVLRIVGIVVVTAALALALILALDGWRQSLYSATTPPSTVPASIAEIGYQDGLSASRRGAGYDVDGSAAFEEVMGLLGTHELPEGTVGRVVELYHVAYASGYIDGIQPK